MSELISIIIPTKNAANHLRLLLPSLLKQSYKHFEVVINDDNATTDDTKNVISQFQKKINIKYIRENKSMAQGRKAGAKASRGKYQLHLDADMVLSPEVLGECLDVVRKGFDALIIPEVSFGEGFWSQVKIFERGLYLGDESIESARFFTTTAYQKVGGHDENMVLSEDKDMDLRIREAGFKVGRIKAVIYHNEGRLSLKRDLQKKFHYGKTAAAFFSVHPTHSFKQGNIIFRPAYFRHWKQLLANPQLSFAMFSMKFLEAFSAFLGLVSTKVPLINIDPWKK